MTDYGKQVIDTIDTIGSSGAAICLDTSMDPKRLIEAAVGSVSEQLMVLDPQLISLVEAQTASANHILSHIFSGGGKRIRPALFFLSCRLVQYSGPHFIPIAAVCEYVHAASLLHDDVIDNSSLRRGKPTANTIWGDESAVLVGDLIYARASELMAQTGSLEIVSMFARAIRLMSDGELLQLEHLFNPSMSQEVYFKIVEHKTAILLGAACRAPAVLAGATKEICDALENFGRSIGFAFQLLDDALDYAGTDHIFGKKTLADLPDGKVTLPVILLKSKATSDEWSFVEQLIHEESISGAAMQHILDLVNQYDTAGQTLAMASSWTDLALKSLSIFPESDAKSDLKTLAQRLLLRLS